MQAQQELNFLREQLKLPEFNDALSAPRLLKLKLLARDPASAPCVYESDGLQVLARIAFDLTDQPESYEASSLEAGRVIANALLLQPKTRQIFADLGYIQHLVKFYSQSSANHEFVGGRILFLLTYNSGVDFDKLVEETEFIDHVNCHLLQHLSTLADHRFSDDPMSAMALTETLKLVYNVASQCPGHPGVFAVLLPALIQIMTKITVTSRTLDPPISQLLNALGIIEWPVSVMDAHKDSDDLKMFAKQLTKILDGSISTLPSAELENLLVAPLTVLRKVVLLSQKEVNTMLRSILLPQDDERDKPIGQSQSLASRLLRLQGSAGVMVLPEAISGLMFDLSDQDASQFVRNIGYGHAAGYLMTHQIPIPKDMTAESSPGNTKRNMSEVNPVTGQKLDTEKQVPMPDMTEEEKEREAERLFVLFERLRATGVVNVENPIRSAQQSGRLEELSDDD